jgi:cardiolipin synthase
VILGRDFADLMEAMFANDLQASNEISMEDWDQRPLRDRFKEWFSRLFSHWL